MSDSAKRCVKTYPNQKIYNEVICLSEKQGTSKSNIVKEALRYYFENKPFILKNKSKNTF
jgi:hypothetical protein